MAYLFVYGTLMLPEVQQAVIGRVAAGQPDKLDGYGKSSIELSTGVYPIISPEPGRSVEGLVLAVTPAELRRIDAYETNAYRRVRVTLVSGRQAWVYRA